MTKGDKVWCRKTGKTIKIQGTRMIRIGERDVLKVVTNRGERFYDEVMLLQRKSDGFFGWLFR